MIVCPVCSTRNDDKRDFCKNCGRKLPQGSPETEEPSGDQTVEEIRAELKTVVENRDALAAELAATQNSLSQVQAHASQTEESFKEVTERHAALDREHQTLLANFEDRLRRVRSTAAALATVAALLVGAGAWVLKGDLEHPAHDASGKAGDKIVAGSQSNAGKEAPVKFIDTTSGGASSESIETRLAVGSGCLSRKHYGCARSVADDVLRQFPGNAGAMALKADVEKAERGMSPKEDKIIIR